MSRDATVHHKATALTPLMNEIFRATALSSTMNYKSCLCVCAVVLGIVETR